MQRSSASSPILSRRTAQAIILVLGGGALVALILLALDRSLIQPTFHGLERQQALEDNARVVAALANELTVLADLSHDWAYWDDAYAFAQDPQPAFIDSNCPAPAALSQNSGIDLLAIFNREGKSLLEMAYNPLQQRVVPLHLLTGDTPPALTLIAPTLQQETSIEGLVDTEYGLLLLVANPILTSEKKGPSRGVVLMGRFLDATRIQALASRTKVMADLAPRHALTASDRSLFDRLASTPTSQPDIVGETVYRLLRDIENKPLTLLRTPVRGDITALGTRTGRLLGALLGDIALALLICLAMYRWRMETAHLALEESEARYRQLFEAESDAIFLIEKETGRILEANQAAATLYGYDREELLRLRNVDLSAEPAETLRITRDTVIAIDQVVTVPLRLHRKKDGTVFPVEITGRFFIHKGRPIHIAAIRDITWRKQVEDQLRFTQFAVDCFGDGAFWINREGQLRYVNEEGCRSLGYTKEELEGKTLADIDAAFPFDTWPQYWRQLQEHKNILLESAHKTKDGRIFPVEIRANYVEFGGQEYNCAIVRDISKRKRLEKERAELEAWNRQRHKEESLGRMAGAIAHLFNNQLMAVMGFIQLALDKEVDKGVAKDLMDAMEAAERAATVSTLMRSYLGMTSCKRRPDDLAEVCRRFLPMLQALFPDCIELRTDLPMPGPVVALNEEQIKQILTNLVTNSLEALEDHQEDRSGWISLSVGMATTDDLAGQNRFPVNWTPLALPYACLAVADNGCGIAPGDMEKLFDPFFTSKFPGRGLGLAVVLGLVKGHDGAVTVASEPKRGSVFRVLLPLASP